MSRAADLRDLYRYNAWANQRILGACEVVSPEDLTSDRGSSFASLAATLDHMAGAEWIWLQRWKGSSPTSFPSGEHDSVASLRARFDEVERERADFIETLSDADFDRVVEYRTTRGAPHRASLADLMRHLANHGTYHRGQVVTLLRQMGYPGVSTDLLFYHREQAAP